MSRAEVDENIAKLVKALDKILQSDNVKNGLSAPLHADINALVKACEKLKTFLGNQEKLLDVFKISGGIRGEISQIIEGDVVHKAYKSAVEPLKSDIHTLHESLKRYHGFFHGITLGKNIQHEQFEAEKQAFEKEKREFAAQQAGFVTEKKALDVGKKQPMVLAARSASGSAAAAASASSSSSAAPLLSKAPSALSATGNIYADVVEALNQGKMNAAEIEHFVGQLDQVSSQFNLDEHRRKFEQALKIEIANLNLPVGYGIVTLIACSHLGDKYVAFEERGKTDDCQKLVNTIGRILSVCCSAKDVAFQDLYFLFMLRNEKKFEELLSLLVSKNMIVVQSAQIDAAASAGLKDPKELDIVPYMEAWQKMDDSLARACNNGKFNETVMQQIVGQVDINDDSSVGECLVDQNSAQLSKYIQLVNTLSAISLLEREIHEADETLKKQEGLTGDIFQNEERESVIRKRVTLNELGKQLDKKKNVIQKNLIELTEELHRSYLQLSDAQVKQMDGEIEFALKKLVKGYTSWMKDLKNAPNELRDAHDKESCVSDHEIKGRLLNVKLELVSKNRERERHEAAIRQQIENARQKLMIHQATLKQLSLMRKFAGDASPVFDSNLITLRFLVELANEYSGVIGNCSDCESMIDLIQLLRERRLFSLEVQHQLLQHKNISLLLKLQQFFKRHNINVASENLIKSWRSIATTDDLNLDLLDQLVSGHLELKEKTILNVLTCFSSTWKRSLAMLGIMFQEKTKTDQRVFNLLVNAVDKYKDAKLIESVYKIHVAVAQCKNPAMLKGFFEYKNMQALIQRISKNHRVADEMVRRLNAIVDAPIEASAGYEGGDYRYLIDRTGQFVSCGLSFASILEGWKEKGYTTFDEFCAVLLAVFLPKNGGGESHKNNAKETNVDGLDSAIDVSDSDDGDSSVVDEAQQTLPDVANIQNARWDVVRADPKFRSAVIDLSVLERFVDQLKSTQSHLTSQEKFLNDMVKRIFSSAHFVLAEENAAPAVVIQNNNLVDGYFYSVVTDLKRHTDELNVKVNALKALHVQLVPNARQPLLTLQTDFSMLSFPQSNGESEQWARLVKEIIAKKKEIDQYATGCVEREFGKEFANAPNSQGFFQRPPQKTSSSQIALGAAAAAAASFTSTSATRRS